jgi:pimeloyl-ACP methyl ester carboxylesterase
MNLLVQILFFLGVGYGALVIFMYVKQESFIFFPVQATHSSTAVSNVSPYSLQRNDVVLKGWLVNPKYRRETLVLYFGGNAEDVFSNIDEFEAIQGASLFVSYRGYGPSSGTPGESELFSDALAVFDDAVEQYSPKNIFLMGRSLGSGVACFVASKRDVRGVILVTPYDSIAAVAQSVYPWLPVATLIKHKFNSVEYASKIGSPVLVLYGGEDRVVVPQRTRSLLLHLNGEKKVVYLERADHSTIDMHPEYWGSILEFLRIEEDAGGS